MLKKTFYDIWDNALRLSLTNLIFIALSAIIILLQWVFRSFPVITVFIILFGIIANSILMRCTSFCVSSISDYKAFALTKIEFINNLRPSLKDGIIMGLFYCCVFIAFVFVMPFYLMLNSMAGLLVAVFLFWFFFAAIMSLQFFYPVRGRLKCGLKQSIKKCFLIFIDNPFFCIFCFLFSIFLFAISIVTGFVFPGFSGVLLFLDEGLRLRILKYNQPLQTATESRDKQKIRWDSLLARDIDKVGDRTLKGLFFPWKD